MLQYHDIVNNLEKNPHDISTIPITAKEGKWFYAYAENGKVITPLGFT